MVLAAVPKAGARPPIKAGARHLPTRSNRAAPLSRNPDHGRGADIGQIPGGAPFAVSVFIRWIPDFPPFTPPELIDLLAKSHKNNAELGISGMLLYKDGNFMRGQTKPARRLCRRQPLRGISQIQKTFNIFIHIASLNAHAPVV